MFARRSTRLCFCLVLAAVLAPTRCVQQASQTRRATVEDLLAQRLAVVERLLKAPNASLPSDGEAGRRTSRLDKMIADVVKEEQTRSLRQQEAVEQSFERQRIDYTPHFHTPLASDERFVTGEFVPVRQYQTRRYRSSCSHRQLRNPPARLSDKHQSARAGLQSRLSLLDEAGRHAEVPAQSARERRHRQ